MGNSIIDQQRDNADFTEVYCREWSKWLGVDFDRRSALNNLSRIVHTNEPKYVGGSVESLFGLIQKMIGDSDRRVIISDPGYWTEEPIDWDEKRDSCNRECKLLGLPLLETNEEYFKFLNINPD